MKSFRRRRRITNFEDDADNDNGKCILTSNRVEDPEQQFGDCRLNCSSNNNSQSSQLFQAALLFDRVHLPPSRSTSRSYRSIIGWRSLFRLIFQRSNVLVCVTAMMFFALILNLRSSTKGTNKPKIMSMKKENKKTILYYNKFWKSDDFQFGMGQAPFLAYNCPVSNCFATNDRKFVSSADAILFHMPDFNFSKANVLMKNKKQHQRFVMFNMESPSTYPFNFDSMPNHFFNWTMTYRWDSDVPRPYGFFKTKHDDSFYASRHVQYPPFNMVSFQSEILPRMNKSMLALAKRPKKVAWIVSNCITRSQRESYVQKLQTYIDVDVFGKCSDADGKLCNIPYASFHDGSNNKSGIGQKRIADNCTTLVERDYKFFLSLENSFCDDYVTEKFFARMEQNSLPIVLGQANYSTSSGGIGAPPHSYVNVLDFESPKHLANFLLRLDSNETEYLSYFWWKEDYIVHTSDMLENFAKSMCHLCEKLNEDENGNIEHASENGKKRFVSHNTIDTRIHSSYKSMNQWWNVDANIDQMKSKLTKQLLDEGDISLNLDKRKGVQPGKLRLPWDM